LGCNDQIDQECQIFAALYADLFISAFDLRRAE
jgi:hypothetical protein